MAIKITFLGTGSMVPTKKRNHSAIFIRYDTEGILVDCGEGTQRQFTKARIPLSKITRIFISHWHGDHTLGIPGVLQSLSATAPNRSVTIYGPKGTKERMDMLRKVYESDISIDIKVEEVSEGVFFKGKNFLLEAVELSHSVPCLGLIFHEKNRRKVILSKARELGLSPGPLIGALSRGTSVKHKGKLIKPEDVTKVVDGKKIGIITDTIRCDNMDKIAKDSDLLISEASYSSDLRRKAEEFNHMTSLDAAECAAKNNVKKLILTHFSARYKDVKPLVDEAKKIFPNSEAAEDLMEVVL